MKKIFMIAFTAAFLGTAATVSAQQDTASYTNERMNDAADEAEDAADKTGNELREGARETGDALEEGAESTEKELNQATDSMEKQWDNSTDKAGEQVGETGDRIEKAGKTGAAEIKDEKIESKVGPNGEPAFIDEHAQYYYIDENGERINVDKSELKDKS